MLSVIYILIGAALLLSGRRLFWLFVAAGGFVAGIQFAQGVLHGPEWLTLVIGLVAGILFATLAMFLRAIAIGLAGFFLGGSIFTGFAGVLGFDQGALIIFLVGGVIGVILVAILFDWALISLSSFAGALLIVEGLNLRDALGPPIFLVLTIIGIAIQGTAKRREGQPHVHRQQ